MEREVRLGIVLYGGVSLAIYENGVTQELFRAVKGEGVYSFLKLLIDSDVVVDIVSGTSAGGINGVMLGFALANGRDVRAAAKLWREDGDFLKLLRPPDDAVSTSLLDSTGYYQPRLQAAFDGMPPYRTPADGVKTAQRIVSDIQEFDLFVTSTDIEGEVYTVFDEQGHPIDIKDHRQVFLLSYREGRKNEFAPRDSAALAKLCRATSGFPVAFEPVVVRPEDPADEAMKRWGRLDGRKEIHFMDGGVLNNKPFTYTIDAIARRTADRSVERLLLYVEPDPERFQADPKAAPSLPNVVQSASSALLDIPGYQSIASDLQDIAALNDRANLFDYLIGSMPNDETTPDCFGKDAPDELALVTDTARRSVWVAARLGQLRDRAVEGILKSNGNRQLLTNNARHAAKILVESFDQWKETPAAATLTGFDVYYRKRRLLHATDTLRELVSAGSGTPPEQIARYRFLWRKLNHQFKLLEVMQFALESALDTAPIQWKDLSDKDADPANAMDRWAFTQNILRSILDTRGANLAAVLDGGPESETAEREERASLMAVLRKRIAAAAAADPKQPYTPSGNLLQRCDELERAAIAAFAPGGTADAVAKEYCRFPLLDSVLFPMQRVSGLEWTKPIRTTRISPIDSKRGFGARSLDEKLCGNELGHFGGFLKRSWRANDTMWGRLDAVGQLIECLVTPERMKHIPPDRIEAALAMDLEAIFPFSTANLISDIRTLAPRLRSGDPAVFESFWEALTQAAQDSIAEEEVPRVITAAIDQHRDWNQFTYETPAPPLFTPQQVWKVSPRRLDAGIAGYAAAVMTRDLRPPGGWPAFLRNDYRIGSEQWDADIPPAILIEMAAQSALVMRNCLLAAAGPYAGKIRKAPLYKFGIALPLLATYRFARLQRTRPEFVWVTVVAGFVAVIAVLALDYVFWKQALSARTSWQFWVWILGPIALGAFLISMLFAFSRPKKMGGGASA